MNISRAEAEVMARLDREHPQAASTTIRTFTGKMVDLAAVLPSDIDIIDIAHSLARICRFNGHTRRFYSVAQHSLQVSKRLPPEWQLEGLLHDAAEAYIGDVTRPLKNLIESVAGNALKRIETSIEQAIALQFGLAYPWPAVVHQVDVRVLQIEQANFFRLDNDETLHHFDRIDPVMSDDAEQLFKNRFWHLQRDPKPSA